MGAVKGLLEDYCAALHPPKSREDKAAYEAQDELFEKLTLGEIKVSPEEMQKVVDEFSAHVKTESRYFAEFAKVDGSVTMAGTQNGGQIPEEVQKLLNQPGISKIIIQYDERLETYRKE